MNNESGSYSANTRRPPSATALNRGTDTMSISEANAIPGGYGLTRYAPSRRPIVSATQLDQPTGRHVLNDSTDASRSAGINVVTNMRSGVSRPIFANTTAGTGSPMAIVSPAENFPP